MEEFLLRDSTMFHQPFPGKGPEPFNAVEVNGPVFEFISMIDVESPVSAEHT
jgi:hypothetical protein